MAGVTSGVGLTALGLAAARSVESGRPDRLIDDPFARALFTAAGHELPMLLDWPADSAAVPAPQRLHLYGSRYIGLRTRIFDDELMAAAGRSIRQAVILGAGLDTRAFRLALPRDMLVIELDRPGVLAFKDRVLTVRGAEERCRRCSVGVDLSVDWTLDLGAAGFDPEQPAVWLAEGLVAYLPAPARDQLLTKIGVLAAPGSTLLLDRIAGDPQSDTRAQDLSRRSGLDMEALLAKGDTDDLAARMRRLGWTTSEQTVTGLAQRYGRDLANPFDPADRTEPPWLDTRFLWATGPRAAAKPTSNAT